MQALEASDSQTGRPRAFQLALAMLFISALPDAAVVPVLRQLLVDRYHVSVGAAHWFMMVNVAGAFGGVWLLGRLRSRITPWRLVTGAAAVNGALLAAMALPIGFAPTLLLRTVEGAADLMVYAALFNVLAAMGSAQTRGRRMGAAATSMMLGIAIGIGLGGVVTLLGVSGALWFGALASIALCPLARATLEGAAVRESREAASHAQESRLWPALLMMGADRALGGLLASTVPLMLASALQLSSHLTGGLIGVAMLMMALGAWPMGRLIETTGPVVMRVAAGLVFAAGLALTAWSAVPIAAGLVLMGLVGLAGAALFASSLVLVTRSGRGAAGMGLYHTAGNIGFFAGPLLAATLLDAIGGSEPPLGVYALVLAAFAAAHLVLNAVATGAVALTARTTRKGRTESAPQAVAAAA